jgi:hypothetical protein
MKKEVKVAVGRIGRRMKQVYGIEDTLNHVPVTSPIEQQTLSIEDAKHQACTDRILTYADIGLGVVYVSALAYSAYQYIAPYLS